MAFCEENVYIACTHCETAGILQMSDMYVYRMVFDGGCAPHDLDGVMSLALCKPVIRKASQVGDLVVALAAVCTCESRQ